MKRMVMVLLALVAFNTHDATAQSVSECPDNFLAFAGTAEPLTCSCDGAATARGSVWGMDVYTGDSAICRAAVHAGAIPRRGGTVSVIPEKARPAYPGLTRNGIASSNYGAYGSSFRFARGSESATPAQDPVGASPPPAQAVSACPDNFSAFADTTEPLSCICGPGPEGRGSIWGMDVYTADSSICQAAVHAGATPRQGGPVSVIPEPGRQAYPGLTRNGVQSSNYGSYASSFRFALPRSATAAPVQPVSACPDNFLAFAETTETLACLCDAGAARRGSLWGMDVYTGDSSICLAAVHAGVLTRQGGPVSVIPEPGRQAYPGLTRNGVQSSNYGVFASSFRFAPGPRASAPPPAIATAAPVQQNIQSSLRERGEVDLYIQFRTNSADLEISAADTMRTLLGVLVAEPSLRLMLIGHTDSVGAPQYNQTLSYRRAQSVRNWLIQQGVRPDRLAIDGLGQSEPIADNGSEYGRASNRRVQVVRM